MSRLMLAVAAFLLAVVGVVASAVVLLPKDDAPREGEMPSGLTGTVVTDPTPAFPVIPTLPPTPDPARNVPEVTLFDVVSGQALPLWQADFFVLQAEFSPDGRWLYYVALKPPGDFYSATIYRLDMEKPQGPAEEIDRGFALRISSRGDVVYQSLRGEEEYLPVVLAADGSLHELQNKLQPGIGARAFVWSPDGRWLAYSEPYRNDSPTYHEYLLDTRTWRSRTFAEAWPCQCDGNPVPMWSPDSSRFTYVRLTPEGPVSEIYSADSLSVADSPPNRGWIDNGRYVGSENDGNAIRFFIFDVLTQTRIPLSAPAQPSPDGSLLATVPEPGVQDADTAIMRLDGTVVASRLEGQFSAWSGDSSLVLANSTTSDCGPRAILIHDARRGVQLLCHNAPIATSVAFSADSRSLAVFTEPFGAPGARRPFAGDLAVIDLATGVEQELGGDIRGFGGACLKWSPDSRFVLVGVCEGI